jgi:hypothetical protein
VWTRIPKNGPSNFRIIGCTSSISSLGVSAIKALPHQAKVNALHIIHHDHDPALDAKTFACSACIIIAGTIIHAGTTEPALDANAAL